jgi:hypothetical protein
MNLKNGLLLKSTASPLNQLEGSIGGHASNLHLLLVSLSPWREVASVLTDTSSCCERARSRTPQLRVVSFLFNELVVVHVALLCHISG